MGAKAMVMQIVPPTGGKVVLPTGNVLAMRARDPWREATNKAREMATQREIIVNAVLSLVRDGVTQNNAVALILERNLAKPNRLPPYVAAAMIATAKKDRQAPTRSTICAWCADYKVDGLAALLPDHKGRVVESAAWWGPDAIDKALTDADAVILSYGIPATVQTSLQARIGSTIALYYLQGAERLDKPETSAYDAAIGMLKAHARGESNLIPPSPTDPVIEGDVISITSNAQRYGCGTTTQDDW